MRKIDNLVLLLSFVFNFNPKIKMEDFVKKAIDKMITEHYMERYKRILTGNNLEDFYLLDDRQFFLFIIEQITKKTHNKIFDAIIENDFWGLIPFRKIEWIKVLSEILKYPNDIVNGIEQLRYYGFRKIPSDLYDSYCNKYINYLTSIGWKSKKQLILDYIEEFDRKNEISFFKFWKRREQYIHSTSKKEEFENEDVQSIISQYEFHCILMEYMETKDRQIIENNMYYFRLNLKIESCVRWTNSNRFEILKIARNYLFENTKNISKEEVSNREKLYEEMKKGEDGHPIRDEQYVVDDIWRADFENINKEVFYQTSDEVIMERYNFMHRGAYYKNMYIKEFSLDEINNMLPIIRNIYFHGQEYINPIVRQIIEYNSPKPTIINPLNQYDSLLMKDEWKDKRSLIIKRDGGRCQKCGKDTDLNVHHKLYIWGRKPWEYSDDDLITLCCHCHRKVHQDNKIPVYFNEKKDIPLKIESCKRCNGSGYLSKYYYYKDGICFNCMGTGYDSFIHSFNKK